MQTIPNFGTLHIKPTVTNKLAIEKFLVKNPEALKEFFLKLTENQVIKMFICIPEISTAEILI